MRFVVQGAPAPEPGRYPVTAIVSVDSKFFKTMGIPILRGRTFNPQEVGNDAEERCVINSTLARTYFGGQDPIGRTILGNPAAIPPEPCQVVGVAGDTLVTGLDMSPEPILYFASYVAKAMLVVRTTADPLALAPAIQREVAAADPEQPLNDIRTMDQVIMQSLSRRSFVAVLLVLFAVLGLILAALGLYGVVSYSVAQRTQEIGVRMAMGAEPAIVLRLVLSEGLWVTGIGLVVGLLCATGATHVMASLLYGVSGPSDDPMSFVVACIVLVMVSTLACSIPAYRAAKLDPLVALRYE
jgi:putative ABC transport system permease protein